MVELVIWTVVLCFRNFVVIASTGTVKTNAGEYALLKC